MDVAVLVGVTVAEAVAVFVNVLVTAGVAVGVEVGWKIGVLVGGGVAVITVTGVWVAVGLTKLRQTWSMWKPNVEGA